MILIPALSVPENGLNNRIKFQTMKKLLYLSILVILFSACKEEDVPGVIPTPGEDVMFSASLEKTAETRTTYADEASGNDSWRINWLNGDMIYVYTPQGESGFQKAPYKVTNTTEDGMEDNTLNYARELNLVNETGVRWGTSEKANFYAVYPYVQGIDNFSVVGTHASVKAQIEARQVNSVPTYTSSSNNIFVKGDMPNNVMYANTLDVPNGTSPVNLKFVPASTVLQFELGCLSVGASATGGTDKPITIQEITVTSPSGSPIAGTLSMNFANVDNPTDIPEILVQDGSNSVTLSTQFNGMNITIPAGGSMTANMFVAVPGAGYDMKEGWTITVKAMEGTFTRQLSSDGNVSLKAGQIHKIKLPKFNRETEWTYEGNSWISTLPSNIYISELSLPGAWYSYDGSGKKEGYQVSGTSITGLFNQGVRAFHLECRVGSTGTGLLDRPDANNSTVVISGTGTNTTTGDGYKWATSISQPVKDIANAVAKTSEFAVLVLNYADGGKGGVSGTWRNLWLPKLKTLIDGLGVSNIYNGPVTPNTTIQQVAGKLIILVCIDNANEQNVTAAQGINALFSYTQFDWTNMSASLISQSTWKGWPLLSNIDGAGDVNINTLYLNYTLANRTYSGTGAAPAGMPDLQNRKDAINSLIANSDVIYAKASHNLWILCGAGGTYASAKEGDSDTNGPQNIARAINPVILNAINQKVVDAKPSPLGLVLVNRITDTACNGPDIIKAIIEMNNKFYLQRDETSIDVNSKVESLSPDHSSALKVSADTWAVF